MNYNSILKIVIKRIKAIIETIFQDYELVFLSKVLTILSFFFGFFIQFMFIFHYSLKFFSLSQVLIDGTIYISMLTLCSLFVIMGGYVISYIKIRMKNRYFINSIFLLLILLFVLYFILQVDNNYFKLIFGSFLVGVFWNSSVNTKLIVVAQWIFVWLGVFLLEGIFYQYPTVIINDIKYNVNYMNDNYVFVQNEPIVIDRNGNKFLLPNFK